MRLDKYINDITGEGRSAIKKKLKAGVVKVNGMMEKQADRQIDEQKDEIVFEGKRLQYASFHYYLLHKPGNVVSATQDSMHQTVIDLLGEDIPVHIKKELFPVGRLDKDTEGLVILTDDGALSHELLSPTKHVEKDYLCYTALPVTDDMIKQLEEGVDIGEKKLTKPAKVSRIDGEPDKHVVLTITEGKFHQVKRMMVAVGNEITYLKRLRMGPIVLPEDLPVGGYRACTKKEVDMLFACAKRDVL